MSVFQDDILKWYCRKMSVFQDVILKWYCRKCRSFRMSSKDVRGTQHAKNPPVIFARLFRNDKKKTMPRNLCRCGELQENKRLFGPQALYWIRNRCPDRLEANGNKRNRQCNDCCKQKYPPTYGHSIGEVLQPFIHEIPRNWRSNDQRYDDKFDKIA